MRIDLNVFLDAHLLVAGSSNKEWRLVRSGTYPLIMPISNNAMLLSPSAILYRVQIVIFCIEHSSSQVAGAALTERSKASEPVACATLYFKLL